MDNRELAGVIGFAVSGSSSLDTGGHLMGVPIVRGISPEIVPGIDGRQWISISGTGFADGARVTLRTGNEVFNIPTDRTSDTEIRVFVNVTSEPAEWTAQVTNLDGASSAMMDLSVNPPIVRPLIGADFGTLQPGESAERVFTVRNTGNSAVFLNVSASPPFSVANGPFANIEPGAERTVRILYAPAAPGRHEAQALFQIGNESATRGLTGRAAVVSAVSGGSVAGSFTNSQTGNPFAGRTLELLKSDRSYGRTVLTNSLGHYRFDEVPVGNYQIMLQNIPGRNYLGASILTAPVASGETTIRNFEVIESISSDAFSQKQLPVVFVRGRGKTGEKETEYFESLRSHLTADGFSNLWDPNVDGLEFLDGQAGINANVLALRNAILARVVQFKSEHNVDPPAIRIVAHSMGGVIVRRMLHEEQLNNQTQKLPKVSDVIMLGTPNAGSVLADVGEPLAFWQRDWQSNKDLKTDFVRHHFVSQWPQGSGAPRLFLAAGTVAGLNPTYLAGSVAIRAASPGNDQNNDGAVTVLSTRGQYY